VGKNINSLNKNALGEKVTKDRELAKLIANAKGKNMFGRVSKPVLKYVNNSNYQRQYNNATKKIETRKSIQNDKALLLKLSTNADVSVDYVKAYAGNTPLSNVNLNSLKQKRNMDLEVAKLNATNVKSVFGKYQTTIPSTKKIKYIKPEEYNSKKSIAQEALEKRQAMKQPKIPNNKKNNVTPNNQVVPNNKKNNVTPNNQVVPNNKKNNATPNNKVVPNNKKNEIVPNKKNEPVPNKKNEIVPNKKNEPVPNKKNEIVPNKKNEPVPNKKNEIIPNKKNEPVPNKKNEPVPNKKNEIVPNKKNEPVPNKKNEIVPNKKNEPVPNKKNEIIPNKKNEPVPNKKNEPVPNKKNEIVPNKKKVTPQNRFKKAVGKIGAIETLKKTGANAKERKDLVSNLVSNVITTVTTNKNAIRMAKRRKVLNEIAKHTNKRITSLKARAANPFRTAEEYNQIAQNVKKMVNLVASENTFDAAAELNKQLNIKGKEINKKNTNKKVREGVEFKIKQIKGLTNADVAEFMKKWDTSKNKTIFNQARKRGAGRLAGKKKTEERAKPKEENNFNASAAMTNLNLAPQRNKLFKKVKAEVGRFGGRIGQWDPVIKGAKTATELTNLEKKLNDKVKLRNEIQSSKLGPLRKRGHREKVMELKNDVGQRRKIFEQQLTDLAQDAKKRELSKYIVGLNIPAENKSRYVKQTNKPGANLNLIRRTVDKQVEEKIAKASKSLVAGAIGKIQAKENKNIADASKSLVAGAITKIKKEDSEMEKLRDDIRKSILPQNMKDKYIKNSRYGSASALRNLFDAEVMRQARKDRAATKIQAAVRGKKNRNTVMNKKRKELTELAKKTKTNFSRNIAGMKNMKNVFKLRGRIEGAIRRNKSLENAKALKGKPRMNPLFEDNGEISAAALAPKPPNAPKPNKPSFRAIVQKEKEKRVVNSVKLAAKKTALSRASGPERVKMARNLAPKTQENVKKVANAVKIFNRQSATSVVNRLKKLNVAEKTKYKGQIGRASTKAQIREIQESAVRVNARKKIEEDRKKEEERKKKADAEAERVRKLKELKARRAVQVDKKKATREAAERSAVSAKKMLTETEKMREKAKEDKAFNDRLAEKRRLLREREAKLEPKKRKPKKKQ
jgi:hypothetical protein